MFPSDIAPGDDAHRNDVVLILALNVVPVKVVLYPPRRHCPLIESKLIHAHLLLGHTRFPARFESDALLIFE